MLLRTSTLLLCFMAVQLAVLVFFQLYDSYFPSILQNRIANRDVSHPFTLYRFRNELFFEHDMVKSGALFAWELARFLMIVLIVGVTWRVRRRYPDFFDEEVGLERCVADDQSEHLAKIRTIRLKRKTVIGERSQESSFAADGQEFLIINPISRPQNPRPSPTTYQRPKVSRRQLDNEKHELYKSISLATAEAKEQ